jgi:hypothetical protein
MVGDVVKIKVFQSASILYVRGLETATQTTAKHIIFRW